LRYENAKLIERLERENEQLRAENERLRAENERLKADLEYQVRALTVIRGGSHTND
jgi:cell division protein FtsB